MPSLGSEVGFLRRLLCVQAPIPCYNTVLWHVQSTQDHVLTQQWTRDMTSDDVYRFTCLPHIMPHSLNRDANAALRGRRARAPAHQCAHHKLCASEAPDMAINGHPDGSQRRSCDATQPRPAHHVIIEGHRRTRAARTQHTLPVPPSVLHTVNRGAGAYDGAVRSATAPHKLAQQHPNTPVDRNSCQKVRAWRRNSRRR
jgi:hypothetical protein